MTFEKPAQILDARGLICPLPVLKARKILLNLKAGDILQVMATDPAATVDFALFCEENGHVMMTATAENGVFFIRLRRGMMPAETKVS